VTGRSLEEAAAEVFDQLDDDGPCQAAGHSRGEQSHRVRLLGGRRLQRFFPVYGGREAEPKWAESVTTSMGPVALVYAPHELDGAERARLARGFVEQAQIPLVLTHDGSGRLRAWTEDGEFDPPEHKERLLGTDHPFLEEVVADLDELCAHPDAGQLVLCGWRAGTRPLSFAIENGAHGGLGPTETQAFALLPRDAPLAARAVDYLRPIDLRHAAFHVLRRRERRLPRDVWGDDAARRNLRIMTYNVHRCLGMDGKLSPERIARVISQYDPDVVALQELDVGRARTGGVDQAHMIAQYLEMDFHFHPAIHVEEERYGDAILTHLPMRLVGAGKLPGSARWPQLEPRGALWVAVELAGTEIQVINTHLSLRRSERAAQAEALLGAEWLGHPDCRPPAVLCGDFNALPSSPVCRKLQSRLCDAQAELESHQPAKTFFGRYPTARIDHVFIDPGTKVIDVEVPNSQLVRVASDHLPLIVELQIPAVTGARRHSTQASTRSVVQTDLPPVP
jgi:endonuclease/exonuclease/phosphatase family metal-dependent hydrolase